MARAVSAAAIGVVCSTPAGAAPTPARFLDCNCLIIGRYVLPAQAVSPLSGSGVTGVSPGGKYSVSAQPGSVQAAAITVTRLADDAVLLNRLEAADWGFSPDDDRLVVALKSVGGSPPMAILYDLTALPVAKLGELTLSAAGSAVSFSPRGAWLLDVELKPTPTSVAMQVFDARTGTRVFQDGFNFTQAPGLPGDQLGAVAVGFGPDTYDRTLTYTYLTGASSSQWTAVNLLTGTLVVDQQPGPAFTWGFSPCGDVIGIVDDHEPQALKDAEVYATLEAHHLGGSGTFPATDDASLSLDANNHLVTHNGTVVTLAPNTAMDSCPAPPANVPPTAAFSAPATHLALISVSFSDQSTDSDGRVVSWAWDFGDGQFSALRSPTHVFLAAGTFTVRLTVTDDGGATDSVSHSITVTANHPPHAAFTFTPATPAAHDVVTFTDQSTDDDDGVAFLDWSIDGVSYSGSVVHARACPPSMNVTLTASDHGGQSDQVTQVIPVTSSGDTHVAAGSDLTAAIAAACPGDRLILDPGHYTGGVAVPETISLKGAGMGATFIDGYGSDPDKWVLRLSPDLTVSDLTVSGGGASTPATNLIAAGGGILVLGGARSPVPTTLDGVEVTANRGNGGIWITDQAYAVTISRSSLHDNQSVMGGSSAIGMSCCADVAIDHTEIAHNSGGGTTLSFWEADGLSFVSNDVHDNDDAMALAVQVSAGPPETPRHVLLSRFTGNGGGIVTDIELLFGGNLVARNGGGGISAGHADQLTVVNSTVADNAGVGIATGIVVSNTIVAGNGTDLGGALGGGGSNLIGGTPGFVGFGDYHLAPGSPAIDMGDNAAVPALLATDADGDPRILNGGSGTARVDIGWDEAITGSPGQDGGVDAGPSDAGNGSDAGSLDAGFPDAGPDDAGVPDDAGSGPSDAGSNQDAGVSGGSDAGAQGTGNGRRSGGGCSSTAAGTALVWLVLAAWVFGGRRRKGSSARRRPLNA